MKFTQKKIDAVKYVIKRQEQLAEEIYKEDIRMTLFDLKRKSFEIGDYQKQLSNFLSSNINNYNNIRNIYKASNESFEYLNQKGDLDNEERIDFIVTAIRGVLNGPENSKADAYRKRDILEQILDLENIVLETHLAKLKYDISSLSTKEFIKILKDRNEKESLKDLFIDPNKYDDFILKMKDYKIIIGEPNNFKIVPPDSRLKIKRFICCIGYLLKVKGKLNENDDSKIIRALQHTFNEEISKGVYSSAKKGFDKRGDKANDYLNALFFL